MKHINTKMLTVDEAAKLWKVERQTMYRWARENKIPHVRVSNRCVRFYDLSRTNDLMIQNTTSNTRSKDGSRRGSKRRGTKKTKSN